MSPLTIAYQGDSPGKNTGVGCHALLQGIFPTQGSNPCLPHCRQILCHLNHQGNPRILEWVPYPVSRGTSQARNRTGVHRIAGRFLSAELPEKPHFCLYICAYFMSRIAFFSMINFMRASLVAQKVKCLPAMRETQVRSLGREDPLEKEMATWKWQPTPVFLPGEAHGWSRLQSMGSQRVGHDWETSLSSAL